MRCFRLGCASYGNAFVAYPAEVTRRAAWSILIIATLMPGGPRVLAQRMTAQEAERLRAVEGVARDADLRLTRVEGRVRDYEDSVDEHEKLFVGMSEAIKANAELVLAERKVQSDAHELIKLELQKEGLVWLISVLGGAIALIGAGFSLVVKTWFRQAAAFQGSVLQRLQEMERGGSHG